MKSKEFRILMYHKAAIHFYEVKHGENTPVPHNKFMSVCSQKNTPASNSK